MAPIWTRRTRQALGDQVPAMLVIRKLTVFGKSQAIFKVRTEGGQIPGLPFDTEVAHRLSEAFLTYPEEHGGEVTSSVEQPIGRSSCWTTCGRCWILAMSLALALLSTAVHCWASMMGYGGRVGRHPGSCELFRGGRERKRPAISQLDSHTFFDDWHG